VIQDKTKTGFGRWIHDVLAHKNVSYFFNKNSYIIHI